MTSPLDEPPASRRLDHLDGLRAVAALYVVLFHAGVCFLKAPLPAWARAVSRLLVFGHEAVAIFIVLSGFCLMLPAARGEGRLAHGVRGYFARRAWRILPPYYAALLVSLALIALVPALRAQAPTGTIWDDTHPAFAAGPVVSHLLLVHNFFPAWVFTINGPLWSVATEWQIYFFLPFVFLPLWRRSALAMLAVAFALGYLPLLLAPAVAHSALPWYLALFALGMVAAGISCAPRALERRLRLLIPWGWLALVLVAICGLGGMVLADLWFRWKPATDALVGLATAALLIHCGQDGPRSLVRRLLSSSPAVKVGHFSYSLYLVHLPVVALCYFLIRALPLGPVGHVVAMIVVSTAASLAAAYAFHLLVERRFMQPLRRQSLQ